MRGLRLRKAAVGFLFCRVNQIGEFDRVLDEEDRDIIADDVPIAFLGVELDRKATDVTSKVGRAPVTGDGRESHKGRGLFAGALKDVCRSDLGERLVILEIAMGAKPAGVHDALGNPFVVEVKDLLAKMLVFQQGRTAGACL